MNDFNAGNELEKLWVSVRHISELDGPVEEVYAAANNLKFDEVRDKFGLVFKQIIKWAGDK